MTTWKNNRLKQKEDKTVMIIMLTIIAINTSYVLFRIYQLI